MDYRCTSGKVLQRIYVVGSFTELFLRKKKLLLYRKERKRGRKEKSPEKTQLVHEQKV